MQAINATNPKIKALAFQATEIRESNDHCSGRSETWSEINFDTFARLIVEACVGVIEKDGKSDKQDPESVKVLKSKLLQHFGL